MINDYMKITNEAGHPVRLSLFGRIGGGFWDDINEQEIKDALAFLPPDREIDILINSEGGSVFTALAIYNLLSQHKGKITITVGGLAASAATLITSIPNATVIMPTGSMMLIHPVRQMAGMPQTPEELREAAVNLEKIRETMIDVYQKKTGQSREGLLALMQGESFLTGQEAVAKGFADRIDETQSVTNTLIDGVATVNGLKVSACIVGMAPEGFFKAEISAEQGVTMNLEKLKAEHPDLVEAICKEAIAEGVNRERARIKAIEEIAVAGHAELVAKAKYENGMTAEMLAVAILKAEREANKARLEQHRADAKELEGLGEAGNTGFDPKAEKKAQEEAAMNAVIEAGKRGFNRM